MTRFLQLLSSARIPVGTDLVPASRLTDNVSLVGRIDRTPFGNRTWGLTAYAKRSQSAAFSLAPTMTAAHSGRSSSALASLQGVYSFYRRKNTLNESRTAFTLSHEDAVPYLRIPGDRPPSHHHPYLLRNMTPSTTRPFRLFVLLLCAMTPACGLLGQAGSVRGEATMVVNPESVCYDQRRLPYLNFDLIVRNGATGKLHVRELRALVTDGSGEMVERRVAAQQALELIGPGRTVGAGEEGLLYNPFTFASVQPGSRIRYEVEFMEDGVAPVALTVAPVPCVTRAQLVLPLAGRILVTDGHDALSHHRRFPYVEPALRELGFVDNPGRFGLDLVVVDAAGRTYRGDGSRNEDWFVWGHPVRAAGDGTVVRTRDGQPDNSVIGSENLWTQRSIEKDEMASAGNYVLIDHGNGEFSLSQHLKAGSVRVKVGDRVRADEAVAEVGNSGASLGPHLHYELRTGWGFRAVRGLPAYFHDVTVVGTGERTRGGPVLVNTGDVLLAR